MTSSVKPAYVQQTLQVPASAEPVFQADMARPLPSAIETLTQELTQTKHELEQAKQKLEGKKVSYILTKSHIDGAANALESIGCGVGTLTGLAFSVRYIFGQHFQGSELVILAGFGTCVAISAAERCLKSVSAGYANSIQYYSAQPVIS